MRIRTFLLLLVILFVLVFSPTNRKQEVMAAQSFFINDVGLGVEISSTFEIIANIPETLQPITVISFYSAPFDPSVKVEIVAERLPAGFRYEEWRKRQVDIPTLYGMQINLQKSRIVGGQEATFRVISSSQYEIWETRLVVNDVVYTIAARHNAETEQLYNAVLKGLRFTDGNIQPPNTSLLFNISSSKAISSFPDLKFPYSGTEQITCAYHQNDPNCHPDSLWALDFGLNYETVRAANTGTATSHYDSCVGNYLKIVDQQDSSYFTLYGHLSSITRTGVVVQGADVAISGATGSCQTGPHLHFLLNHNGANIRPEPMCGESGFLRYQWHSDCWNDTFTNPSFESGQVAPWQWVGPCNRAVYQNSQIAHHGSYYLATNRNNNANCTSFFQDIIQAPVPGNTYRFAVWVRSSTGTNRQGRVAIWALGGQQENHDTPFSINGTGWQCVETTLSVQNSGHYAVRTEVYLDSLDSVDYYFDDMHYQQNGGLLCPPPPTSTPQPTNTPVPTNTPRPPTATPYPTATSVPTNTPLPTATLTPFPSLTPTATATPIHTATPISTATPTPTITPVPTGTPTPEPMVWDDVSCTVQYDDWYGVIDNAFLGGCARATSIGNQWLAYRTSQATTTLGMVTYLGPDQGKAWVMIDGQLKGILDLYSPTPIYQIHQVYTNLPQTQHTIIIGATGHKNSASTGVEVRVDGFVVSGQTLDETAAGVILRTWNSAVLPWAYGGSIHLTTQVSAVVSFEVVGTQFTWITLLCPTCGQAAILIDDVPFTTIDTYNPTWQFQHEQVIAGLPPGVHMVQIRAQEIGSQVFFDGYTVP